MIRFWIYIFLFIIFAFAAKPLFAQSTYVLPYPSFMPGNILYKPHVFINNLVKYWYFGSMGDYKYNLKQADKYLVEARTLFEYKQYLLGYKALQKSDEYFVNIPQALRKAKNENKDIGQKEKILKEASLKHIEVLSSLKLELPETFIWVPEKESQTTLRLLEAVNESIKIREKSL